MKKREYFCEDAFLHNPVASAHDCTGFSPTQSYTEEEAESKAQLCDVPASSEDGGEATPPAR
ncbi:MAG: hypothetical protein IKU26_03500 [Clostridia bacterium]|nr:hypothetical protein [Clostridia bacterium]